MSKGSRRRQGKIPDNCPLWKDYKPPYLKTEAELAAGTGHFVLDGAGNLVRGHTVKMDNNTMKSVSFGRHRGQQKEQLAQYDKDGITGPVGYDSGGALIFEGGYQTQKRLVEYHGQGKLGID